MGSIVVQAFITLDGVVQGGGGPDEDRDGGFQLGGWSMDYDDELDTANEGGELVTEWESKTQALLLGRRTYEIWASAWGVWDENAPGLMGELTRRYNRIPKYVASTTLTELEWQNSHLLGPDVPSAVRRIREEQQGEIRIWGSTKLIRTLAEHDLIDEYRLALYPIVLGTGKRLFPDGFSVSTFAVLDSRALASGVVVTTYGRSSSA